MLKLRDLKINRSKLFSTGIAIALLIISICVRFYNLSNINTLVFDENFYIPMAEKYIDGEFYSDPHPPLGRLIFAAGSLLYPDQDEVSEAKPYGNLIKYRIPTASFGALIPVIVFLTLLLLTKSRILSSLGALMLVFDNALIVYSRYALFDEIMICFVLLSLLFSLYFIKYKQKKYDSKSLLKRISLLLLASVFAGLAVSTKLNGLVSIIFIVLAVIYKTFCEKLKLNFKHQAILAFQIIVPLLTIAVIYIAVNWMHFQLFENPGDTLTEYPQELQDCFQGEESSCELSPVQLTVENTKWMFNFHEHIGPLDPCKEGEIGSFPHQWPFMYKPIALSFTSYKPIPFSDAAYVYFFGNPLVWYLGLLSVIVTIGLLLSSIFTFKSQVNKKILFIFFAYIASYLPYLIISRTMYIYMYLNPFVFSIMLFIVLLEKFLQNSPLKKINRKYIIIAILFLSSLIIATFLVYLPITYKKKISIDYMDKLILTDRWGLSIDPYNHNQEGQ